MQTDPETFYAAALSAGAILSRFCGTFLSFRIQREAAYYRQPALDYSTGKAKDVFINLSHFTSSFLLLISASLLAVIFGVVLPLLALGGVLWIETTPKLVISGLISTIVFIIGYFVCELVHYGILNRRLLNDPKEWGRARKTVSVTVLSAVLASLVIWWRL